MGYYEKRREIKDSFLKGEISKAEMIKRINKLDTWEEQEKQK